MPFFSERLYPALFCTSSGSRAGALGQWLKLPAWKFGDRVFEPHSGLRASKKQTVSSPLIRKDIILWGISVTESWRARLHTTGAQMANPVSGGQCHLIHLTVLRRLPWPSLAYMCTKVAKTPIHFISRSSGAYTDTLVSRGRTCHFVKSKIPPINPLSPHDALKHHFTSLKTYLIFLQLGVLERNFPWNWFTNTWQFSLIFHPPEVIFIHYKSRIAAAIRGL